MRNYQLIFVIIFSSLLTSCANPATLAPEVCGTQPGCAVFNNGEPIRIGTAGPMSGEYSQYGIDMANAMKIAAADAGVFNGSAFEIIAYDDLGTPEGAAAVANKLITDTSVVAMAGHSSSGATAAALPIYESASIPVMSPSATNPDLTALGSKVFNRNAFTDAYQAFGTAAFMDQLGITSLAILHDGTDYGQALAANVRAEFEKLGGEILFYDAITPGEFDYSPPLLSIQNTAPDAIYFAGYMAEASILVNQRAQLNMDDIFFITGDGVFGGDFLDKTGENGEGVFASTLVPPNSDNVSAFNEKFTDLYGTQPGSLSAFSWNSYDAAAVLIEAVRSVAIVVDGKIYIPRAELAKAVRATKDHPGLTGTITCLENGECNQTGPVFYQVTDGNWQPAK